MRRVAIIEDEVGAQVYLKNLLQKVDPAIKVVTMIESVRDAVPYFQSSPDLDLAFMDIQIADGLSFEIFEHVSVTTPVIFTTAYDQYAIDAFQVNSVDYLLKPIMVDELTKALIKYKQFHAGQSQSIGSHIEKNLAPHFGQKKKRRCLVKRGGHFEYINVEDIMHVLSEDSVTFLFSRGGQRFIYAKPISQLIEELDPAVFFQINRSQIVNINDVKEAHPFLNQRLKVLMHHQSKGEGGMIVSRPKVQDFKAWLDQ